MALKDERLTGMPEPAGRRRPWPRLLYLALAVAVCLALAGVLIVVVLAPDKPGKRGVTFRQAEPGPPPAPAGIVTVTEQPTGFLLAFHDVNSGKVTRTASSTVLGITGAGMRQRFNADFTMFAWADRSGVHVARLTETGYVEAASWAPSPNPDYSSTWDHAAVNPATGRVWFAETRVSGFGGGLTAQSIRVVSIDPNVAGDQPRLEQADGRDTPPAFDAAGAPAHQRTVELTSDRAIHATLVATGTQVVSGTLTVTADVTYDCPAPLGPATLVCYTDVRSAPYGSVAELSLDPNTQQATMRQLLPTLDSPVQGLLVSPDRKQLRLQTQRGWLALALPGAGAPQPVTLQEPATAPLAWI